MIFNNIIFIVVGSFVWTHLQNLKKTSVPFYLELQTMLAGDINKKFNTDIRKFSRNYENSFFLSEYGVGKIFWRFNPLNCNYY